MDGKVSVNNISLITKEFKGFSFIDQFRHSLNSTQVFGSI